LSIISPILTSIFIDIFYKIKDIHINFVETHRKMHYDFIEIGTSDFDTLIENADNKQVGLTIEPLAYYLNRLPNKNFVIKVQSAISDKDGFIEIYYITEDKIIEHNLPYWIRGCNSVDKPHVYARQKIGEELYDSIVTIDSVMVMSWDALIEEYNITSVKYLKIDTEGHDHIILKGYLESCKRKPSLLADKIEFEYNEISDKEKIWDILKDMNGYIAEKNENDIVLKKITRKAFILYANEAYADLAEACVYSLNKHSKYPVYVYMLDSDIKIRGAITFRWESQALEIKNRKDFIDRDSTDIYKLLIERPAITKHALEINEVVCYVDCDSIATKYVDTIFDYYNEDSAYPYFVEGIYDWLHINGRGGAESRDDLSTTLEHPSCELFNVNQYVRQRYRQTGYYVAGRNTIDFLEEWYWMCNHPKVIKNHTLYAPYHEETIANVLLWKYNYMEGLPYIYMNGYREAKFTGEAYQLESWVRIPATENKLLFYHGEKNIQKIKSIINEDIIPSTTP